MVKDPVPLAEVRRALVIKLRHHGDVLLAAPVFSLLKARAPHLAIDALVYADTADMLTLHPAIDTVHRIDRDWKRRGPLAQARAEWRLLAALRARRYDLIVHLTEHRRGAWLSRLLAPRWAVAPGLPDRAGRRDRFWRGSFTHLTSVPATATRPTVETNLDALRRIGLQPTRDERRVTLVPGAEAEQRVATLLAGHGLTPRRFVHLHPASRWHFKCWTAEGWAAVIGQLEAAGWPVLLTAAPGAAEGAMVAAIQRLLPRPVPSLAGALSLKELAAVAAAARLFVGVDSAPMHIAAAMDTPALALFGPSGELQWGPWSNDGHARHRVIVSTEHTCRPCGIDGCGGGKVSDCLQALTAERIAGTALTMLAAAR